MAGGGIAMWIGGEITRNILNQFAATSSQALGQQDCSQIRAAASQRYDRVRGIRRQKSRYHRNRKFRQHAAKPSRVQLNSSYFVFGFRNSEARFVYIQRCSRNAQLLQMQSKQGHRTNLACGPQQIQSSARRLAHNFSRAALQSVRGKIVREPARTALDLLWSTGEI